MIEFALAALLHDVGKVYERTGKESEKLDHLFKYSHAGFTSRFFEDLQHDEGRWNAVSLDRIKTFASYHHNPSDSLQELITIADRCSAGERREDKDIAAQSAYGKSRRRLRSLFSEIKLPQNNKEENAKETLWEYPLASMAVHDERVFPRPVGSEETTEEGEEAYKRLYDDFYDQMRRLRDCPSPLLVDAVMGICRSHWTLIPSSAKTVEIPDITLYDHSVVSAAIACALFAHRESNEATDKKMLLVSGDISGIQDFLLDLPSQTSPGTAKLLRARSFYVTMLTRIAAVMILDRLGLPACNCLKDAGGQFTLLVQNTAAARTELANLQRTFDQWMLQNFQGRLALILSEPVEIAEIDFQKDRYAQVVERLNEQTDRAKKRKFRSALQTDSGWNIDAAVMDTVPPDEQKLDKKLKRVGTDLTTAKYIVLSREVSGESVDSECLDFFNTLTLSFYKDVQHLKNDTNVLSVLEINPDGKARYRFAAPYFMTRHVPRIDEKEAAELNANRLPEEKDDEWRADQVRPFDKIAALADGVKHLAVLKADVDRLGQIFSRGLKETASISRFTVLSRLLNDFFTAVLEHRLKTELSYENIYTEYAGGDDLLFVGPWDKILRLASEIRRSFTEYTCDNADVTLSASVVLGHAKSPISSLVRQAETLLDKAKSAGRNRIGIFGTTLLWKDFDGSLEDGRFLYDYKSPQGEKISHGFLYRLLRYYQMDQRVRKDGSIRDVLWKSQLRYDMARNCKDQALRDRLDRMVPLTVTRDTMERLKVAVTYALYLGR